MKPTNILDVLVEARSRIERPECRTKGALARNGRNGRTSVTAGDAVCWCAEGAIMLAGAGSPFIEAALDAVHGQVDTRLWAFNDTSTHAAVLAAFDRAIAAQRSALASAE